MKIPRYLECRTYGHAWEEAEVLMEKKGFLVARLFCMRCHTSRVDLVRQRTGEVLKRKYKYPFGYLVKGGVQRAAARREMYEERYG